MTLNKPLSWHLYQHWTPSYLEHHMKHHGEATLAWIFSYSVHRRQIKEDGIRLLANCIDQHLFAHTCRPCQQDWLNQRSLLMHHLTACRQQTSCFQTQIMLSVTFILKMTWIAAIPNGKIAYRDKTCRTSDSDGMGSMLFCLRVVPR